MKIFIVGLTGMLGHKIFLQLKKFTNYKIYCSTSSKNSFLIENYLINNEDIFYCDNYNFLYFDKLFAQICPDIVINCTGALSPEYFKKNPIDYIYINSLLPNELSTLANKFNFRFIHFSTDILYSENTSNSKEDDSLIMKDSYSASKFLGEVNNQKSLTVRTSIIGHQIKEKNGLVEWLISQRNGLVSGFSRVNYSGLTTLEISKIIINYIIPNVNLNGIINISSNPISKYEILNLMNEVYNLNIKIIKDESMVSDRSLSYQLFANKTGYQPKTWVKMIKEMYKDYSIEKIYKKI